MDKDLSRAGGDKVFLAAPFMSTEEAEGVKQAGGQVMRATGKAGYVRNFPAPTVLVRVDRLFWSERPDHEQEPVAGMVVEKQGRTMDALAVEAPDDPPDAPCKGCCNGPSCRRWSLPFPPSACGGWPRRTVSS